MKAHLGVDSRIKLIHAVVPTPANAADNAVLPDLLHGKEADVAIGLPQPTCGDPASRTKSSGL